MPLNTTMPDGASPTITNVAYPIDIDAPTVVVADASVAAPTNTIGSAIARPRKQAGSRKTTKK